jgi:hypothetical protein
MLSDLNLVMWLFDLFDALFLQLGLITKKRKIIDASIIEAPRQRKSNKENAQICLIRC